MRRILLSCVIITLLAGCSKEQGPKVDIYLLKSFSLEIDTTKAPPVSVIKNAILEDVPLVADKDIRFYTRESSTFTLRKDIQAQIKNYGADKAFAVTVDSQVVYYGTFHPAYLSSIVIGLATTTPLFSKNNEFRIDFVNFGATITHPLDKRNDSRIIEALRASGRLR